MKYLIGAFTLSLLLNCNSYSDNISQTGVSFRVQNESKHVLSDVSIFSIDIGNLNPGETSQSKLLNYNKLNSDPMINLKVGESNLIKYLFPDTLNNNIYVIDSLDIESGLIYLSLLRE